MPVYDDEIAVGGVPISGVRSWDMDTQYGGFRTLTLEIVVTDQLTINGRTFAEAFSPRPREETDVTQFRNRSSEPAFPHNALVEVADGSSKMEWRYVGPIGADGEHILYREEDKRAYRTFHPHTYRIRRPRKGDIWADNSLVKDIRFGRRVYVVAVTDEWVMFTARFSRSGDDTVRVETTEPKAANVLDFMEHRELLETV